MANPGSERVRLAPICWYSSSEPSAAKKCLRISMGLRTYSGSPQTHSSCHRPTRNSSKPALASCVLDGNIAFHYGAVEALAEGDPLRLVDVLTGKDEKQTAVKRLEDSLETIFVRRQRQKIGRAHV